MKKKTLSVILQVLCCVCLLLPFSCGTTKNVYVPFRSSLHGDAIAEWPPHNNTTEWWYVTGYLNDNEGRPYFYQFTIFHGYKFMTEWYAVNLSLVDFTGKHHYFYDKILPTSEQIYGGRNLIVFKNNWIRILPDRIDVRAETREFGFSFTCLMDKEAVWHGKDGVIIMGHKDKTRERSFYYSITRLTTYGEIWLPGSSEILQREMVTGYSWFDRQWGRFTETGWDWFSFRLADGVEIMLFAFPSTGHQEGTLVAKDGNTSSVEDFSYTIDKTIFLESRVYGNEWTVTFPDRLRYGTVKVVPLTQDQYNPGSINKYWEGLCNVYNSTGQWLGYCVVETTLQSHNR